MTWLATFFFQNFDFSKKSALPQKKVPFRKAVDHFGCSQMKKFSQESSEVRFSDVILVFEKMLTYNPTQNLVIRVEEDETNNPTSFFFVSHERWGRGGVEKEKSFFVCSK